MAEHTRVSVQSLLANADQATSIKHQTTNFSLAPKMIMYLLMAGLHSVSEPLASGLTCCRCTDVSPVVYTLSTAPGSYDSMAKAHIAVRSVHGDHGQPAGDCVADACHRSKHPQQR